jgi:UDP-N-acetylmuramyl pentapeptide phosphotransferase/UDP-N-acetylglucosamine-1-phosphate transferase
MKKIPTLVVVAFTILFALPYVSKAQVDSTNPDGPPDGGDPGTDVPFDGGISILIATAVGYGITKMKKEKETKEIE